MPTAVRGEFHAAITMRGLTDLQRAFKMAEKGLSKDLKEGLKSAAEPIRTDAERLASGGITRIGPNWWKMRTGVTQSLVYVAPVERGVKTRGRDRYRRPKFKYRLLDVALDPALEQNIGKVEREVEDVLEDLARAWSRV